MAAVVVPEAAVGKGRSAFKVDNTPPESVAKGLIEQMNTELFNEQVRTNSCSCCWPQINRPHGIIRHSSHTCALKLKRRHTYKLQFSFDGPILTG